MKTKVLVEVNLEDLNQDVVHDYAREAFNYRYPSEISCDCNCGLHEYDPEDIVEHLEMEGFIMLDGEVSLRMSMALAEFKAKLELGRITVEMIEQLNNRADEK